VIREVQTDLRALGFRPGPIDGIAGKATSEAVKAFQRVAGLPEDGRIDANSRHLIRMSNLATGDGNLRYNIMMAYYDTL
jgi:peptidoglycan hydrolase-like protein with peptidoglycan-binding domain